METQAMTVRTIDLGYEQVLLIDTGPGTRIRVLYGAMWLTEEGCADDGFARLQAEVDAEVAVAVAFARASPFPAPREAFEDLWA